MVTRLPVAAVRRFACLLAILGLGFVLMKTLSSKPVTREHNLKVSYNFYEGTSGLDTAKIRTVYEYELIHNLYSRLVEYDLDSQLVPGVADSFSTTADSVIFNFGSKVKTLSGHLIDAQDAAISLKRLVMLGRSGHGDIRRLLCPNQKLKSINDDCPGISVRENQLVLKPVRPHYLPFLISALESADYSIIPKSSLDLKTLKIIDFKNTSGPYYVERDSEKGALIFKANPGHYHYSPDMPQTVELVPTPARGGPDLLLAGSVDLVTTAEYFSGDAAEKVISDTSRFNVHATQPFRVDVVCFSESAVRGFSPLQRIRAAQEYAEVKMRFFRPPGSQPSIQFFQALSEGTLSTGQLKELEKLYSASKSAKFSKPINLGVVKQTFDLFKDNLKGSSDLSVVRFEQQPYEYPAKDRPDMYNIATDSAWTENLSLLGHNFEMGIFHSIGGNSDTWFERYLNTSDREARISKLNQLHFELLKNAVIVPYNAYPYYAVSKKEWMLNFSKLTSDTDLWRMRKN